MARQGEPGSTYFHPSSNPYGFVNGPDSLNPVPFVTRSKGSCGMDTLLNLPSPSLLFGCFEESKGWTEAMSCLSQRVRFQLNSYLSGRWDCALNISRVFEDNPGVYSRQLLSFVAVAGWLGPESEEEEEQQTIRSFRSCEGPKR